MIGRRLGNWRIEAKIGAGGMGEVWRARHAEVASLVAAVKTMPEGFGEKPELVARFHREAEVMARLKHPNIVPVIDFGKEEETYYLAMEYLEGGSLAERIAKKELKLPLGAREAAEILVPVCEALEHAHGQGVLHRDLKPGNILFTKEGVPKLSDFGLAKILENVVRTGSGSLLTGSEVRPRPGRTPTIERFSTSCAPSPWGRRCRPERRCTSSPGTGSARRPRSPRCRSRRPSRGVSGASSRG